MGCGNSSPTISTNSSSAGRAEFPSKLSDEAAAEDDKRKNYGGVYVGLPADLSNIPQVQIGSLREADRDSPSLRRPLWGDGL
ncbi:overexpressed in colon carcinoma 1 protein homolog [Stegastes partitus]|uniref:Overexpressed in colon carcinoma 1 protein homolog n=1 Tax=Stegastes partitus TaxID=144197 RepID=A0A9Y4NUP0_9TELE|nr:PREDICTED: overexpressed in colon carcinoma 1 protein homolog [Stegastes partitus]XP_008303754.1 PREDICTED: overexpressed in colon carcinoma 1 protein homolog [Stegastes partitus]